VSDDESKKVDNNRRVVLAALAGGALTGAAALTGQQTHAAASETLSSEKSANSSVDLNKKGMQLIITGSGSALPDPLRGGASCAVVVDGVVLQFDCGRRVLENLMLVGINPMKIDHLFFTHMHFDHIADYDYFVISNWIAGRQEIVNVYGPKGTESMSNGAIRHMHAMDYDFVHEILTYWPPHMKKRPTQEPPFKAKNISPGVVIETDKFKVSCLETDHLPFPNMSSLGYRIDSEYGSVAISGDTGVSDGMLKLGKDVDILVHECVKPDLGMTPGGGKFSSKDFHSDKLMKKRPQTGHTSPTQLGKLAQEAGAKKLIAYHLAPYTSVPAAVEMSSLYLGSSPGPSIWAKFTSAMKKQYDGPVILAEDRMIFNIQK
jgi:ribonuclease Z